MSYPLSDYFLHTPSFSSSSHAFSVLVFNFPVVLFHRLSKGDGSVLLSKTTTLFLLTPSSCLSLSLSLSPLLPPLHHYECAVTMLQVRGVLLFETTLGDGVVTHVHVECVFVCTGCGVALFWFEWKYSIFCLYLLIKVSAK